MFLVFNCVLLFVFLKSMPVYLYSFNAKQTTDDSRRLYETHGQMQNIFRHAEICPHTFWNYSDDLSLLEKKIGPLFLASVDKKILEAYPSDKNQLSDYIWRPRQNFVVVGAQTVDLQNQHWIPNVLLRSYVISNINLMSSCLSFLTCKRWGPGSKILYGKSSHNIINMFLKTVTGNKMICSKS